jgi:hypothetical protein
MPMLSLDMVGTDVGECHSTFAFVSAVSKTRIATLMLVPTFGKESNGRTKVTRVKMYGNPKASFLSVSGEVAGRNFAPVL